MINRHAVLDLIFRGAKTDIVPSQIAGSGIGRMGVAVFGLF